MLIQAVCGVLQVPLCISALVESRLTLIKLLQKLSIDQLYEVLSLYNQAKLRPSLQYSK